ncbi:MAG: glycosyltransferase family 1 protein [Bacilli bacterium]|nr:glycosyltransferase family 1 protein [Bacilli bacterium]
MKKIVINGRIFEFPITGVGRFCNEVILELDKIVEAGKLELVIPSDAKNVPKLSNIKVKKIGTKSGIFWEQITLPLYLIRNKALALNMSNSAPIIKPNFVVLHDIGLKVNKGDTSNIKERFKISWPLLQYKIFSLFSKMIFTDTVFQKNEIIREYKVKSNRIEVVNAGWQHEMKIDEDEQILKKLNLEPRTYYFAMSTRAKNKNFRWIYEVALKNPNCMFLVAGNLQTKYFSDELQLDKAKNILYLGYITDEEAKTLMKNCKAFIYPSFYEGFGIPPMEAMSMGADIIISNTSCLPEVYMNSAHYINPYDYNVNLDVLLEEKVESSKQVLNQYSWAKTAKILYETIAKYEKVRGSKI